LLITFGFTGVYLKYVSISQELIVCKLEGLVLWYRVTQDGDNKFPTKIFDSNFLFLVCRLRRAPWETRMASGWRGHVWALKKSGVFRDSARDGLQTSAVIHIREIII
jgi:hypothetical protein